MHHLSRYPRLRDALNIVFFIAAVIIGAWLINALLFRSFNVIGPSMEPTLVTNDRLIINRLPVTFNAIQGKEYVPERGQVIVFKNPHYSPGSPDEYIVKRVIGLPGERVTVSGGEVTVYNREHPGGFDPYDAIDIPDTIVTGIVDRTVPEGEIFVIGDHRTGEYSLDSRNGLGTVALHDIIGPVSARVFPFTKFDTDL